MKPRFSAALLGLLIAVSGLQAQDSVAVGTQVSTWYARAKRFAPGAWGIVVADHSGKVLWSSEADTPLIPASTVKLLTTGFARSAVGGDARSATRVIGEGQLDQASGTWQGRWALELNGDVTLERSEQRGGPSLQTLANQLAAIGVRRLIGPLVVTSASPGDAQSHFPAAWDDRHRGRLFAPLVGETMLNEGLVTFTVGPSSRIGASAVLIGAAPNGVGSLVGIGAKTVEGSHNTSLRFSALANGRYYVSGTIGSLAKARSFTMVAKDPQMVLEAVWAHATATAGIEWIQAATSIGEQATGDRRVLAEIVSEPFDSVAHEVNTRSLNIGAEMMLLWGGGLVNAADQLNQHIAKITGLKTGFHLVDGSGLSGDDRVAPIVFTTYLARFPLTSAGKNFPLLLPANGSGTLRKLASGLPEAGVVRAKTGTLGNVSTLVGYLGRNDGTLLIAAMYNGGNVGAAKSMEWDLFRRLGAKGVILPDFEGGDTVSAAPGQDTVRVRKP